MNTLLEEKQQRIEGQTEELYAQKEQLIKFNSELEETVATKNKFFSIIAHDLKNPINSLLGFSELLYKKYNDFDKEKTIKLLKIVYTSSLSISDLIENLLTWSRLQSGRIAVNKTRVDITTIVNKACELLESSLKQKKINIVINIETDIKLKADAFMISSVLHNLLSNAIKFTHPEGTITISAEHFNEELIKTRWRS